MVAAMETDLFTTLDESKEWLQENVDEGAICPCCERFDKIYNRRVCVSAITNLVSLYRVTKNKGAGYYHYSDFFAGKVFPGDMARLRFIGLVSRDDTEVGTKKTSGMYKITEDGIAFVNGHLAIPERMFFYHDQLVAVSPEEKHIQELWPDFNYQELMGAA